MKNVTRDQVFKPQFIDFVRIKQLPPTFYVPIARAKYFEPGAHQIKSRTVRSHIEQAKPEVHVAAVARKKNIRMDPTGHFHVLLQLRGIEGQDIFAVDELAIVMRARGCVRVCDWIGGIREERTEASCFTAQTV